MGQGLRVTFPLGDEAYTPHSLGIMRDIIYEGIKWQYHIFSIVDLGTNDLIWRCLLFDIDPLNRRAMLGMFSFNERALVCYRLVGFKEIERRRKARIIGGKKHNLVKVDMRADEQSDDKAERADSTRAYEGG